MDRQKLGASVTRIVTLAAICACVAGCMRKGKTPKVSGAAWLRLYAQYDRVVSDDRVADLDNRGTVGVAARGLLGSKLAYCAGFDASFGGSEGAFAYDASLYLLGGGVRLGKVAHLAVCAGAGLSGAAGALPFSWQLPVEASLAFNLGRRVRPAVWVRGVRLLGAGARRDGSRSLDVVDELSVTAGVRIGKSRGYRRLATGNGYFLGVSMSELVSARFIGVTFGHGINVGN